ASNLPRPVVRPGGGSSSTTRRTENTTYQSSKTVRHMKIPHPILKRMSLAVLIDQNVRWEGAGSKSPRRILEPQSPEKLKTIRELVAAATGFSAERGDQLTIESLPFDSTLTREPPMTALPAATPP